MDLVITGGTMLDASGSRTCTIGVSHGRIAAVAPGKVDAKARETIDATGKIVMPGVVDVHVHMALPVGRITSSDDFRSGTRAAAFGGVTTVIDFATQRRGRSLAQAIDERLAEAEGKSAVDFSLHCAITDWNDRTRREMKRVVGRGITSFKLFMAYQERGLMSDDGALYECLREAASLGAIVGVHAENAAIIRAFTEAALRRRARGAHLHGVSRPPFSEVEAVQRAAYLASRCRTKTYVFHTSTMEAAMSVETWAQCGYPVHAETCPHYLTLTEQVFRRSDGHLYATCPPVRTERDRSYLWDALAKGGIGVVSTDHCSFTRRQKDTWRGDFRRIPSGLPGVETLLPLVFTRGVLEGRIAPEAMVRLLCENPAKTFGLFPKKGTIRTGSDADILVIDPKRKLTVKPEALHMNCDWSPYDGLSLHGFPEATILRGKIIQRDGRFLGASGDGRFVKRA